MDWRGVRFDWNRARAFLVTAEEGSFSAAARALQSTQTTVGRQVAALEESLGVALLERVGNRMELTEAGTNLLESYFKRVAYRLGFYYDHAYVTPVAGTDINTIALTGGFSPPALLAGTRLDINFEVGTRGTTDDNLVRDRFFGVSATLNVGERWFVKRKLR